MIIKYLFFCFSFSNSDDNLLKNIELFDKLSLRFNGRILFVKDVIGSQEICCWSFYGHAQKISEVCCTSTRLWHGQETHTKVTAPSKYCIRKIVFKVFQRSEVLIACLLEIVAYFRQWYNTDRGRLN